MSGLRASDCEKVGVKSVRVLISILRILWYSNCFTRISRLLGLCYCSAFYLYIVLAGQLVYPLDYSLDFEGIFRIPVGARDFSCSPYRPTQPLLQRVPGIKEPSSVEVECAWRTSPYACLFECSNVRYILLLDISLPERGCWFLLCFIDIILRITMWEGQRGRHFAWSMNMKARFWQIFEGTATLWPWTNYKKVPNPPPSFW